MPEVRRDLWPDVAKEATLYFPGRYLIFCRDEEPEKVYYPEDIQILDGEVPALTPGMQKIWDARTAAKFGPDGFKGRNGVIIGMSDASLNGEYEMTLPIFRSSFLDWQLTLPWVDKDGNEDPYNKDLERSSMRPPLCMHHACITRDGYFLYAMRGVGRASHTNKLLGLHSWGYDIDRDDTPDTLLVELHSDDGHALFKQAQFAVLREVNPYEAEVLLPHHVVVDNISCLTLHIEPYDYGWHLCTVVKIDRDAKELLDERNKYPMPDKSEKKKGRIGSYHAVKFDEEHMKEFFRQHHDRFAVTIEPALIMACVQEFGEDFLKKLPWEHQRGI